MYCLWIIYFKILRLLTIDSEQILAQISFTKMGNNEILESRNINYLNSCNAIHANIPVLNFS